MALIVFYEKPGCGGNARQKALLREAGHELLVRDLLAHPWTEETLLEFLAPLPVSEWFNRAAPAVKSEQIVPESLSREEAIQLLLATPLLIRRPLLEALGQKRVGFDARTIDAWLGLGDTEPPRGPLEGCVNPLARCKPAKDEEDPTNATP